MIRRTLCTPIVLLVLLSCAVLGPSPRAWSQVVGGDLVRHDLVGGDGGDEFSGLTAVARRSPLESVVLEAGPYEGHTIVTEITVVYRDGTIENYSVGNSSDSTTTRIDFPPGCYLSRMAGNSGTYVDQIILERTCIDGSTLSVSAGGTGGGPFGPFDAEAGYEIAGFWGRQGNVIDAIGPITRLRPTVSLAYPGTGDLLTVGSDTIINWSTNKAIRVGETMLLTYNKTGCSGLVTDPLAVPLASISNGGAYSWTGVPSPGSVSGCLRVAWSQDPGVFDEVDVVFPEIVLQSPQSGDNLVVGQTIPVRWRAVGLSGTVNVELSRDGGLSFGTLESGVSVFGDGGGSGMANGTYTWTWANVPAPISDKALLRVASTTDPDAATISPSAFSIIPAITVTYPSGGERFVKGFKHRIEWTTSGLLSSAEMLVEVNCDGVLLTIATDALNTGQIDWTPPMTCATARAIVTWKDNPAAFGMSAGSFTVAATVDDVLTVGVAVTPPPGAAPGKPAIEVQGSLQSEADFFAWSSVDGTLYPIAPGSAILRWPDGSGGEIVRTTISDMPANPQDYVIGTEVNITGAGTNYKFLRLGYNSSGAVVRGNETFSAAYPGYAVLHYTTGSPPTGDPNVDSLAFEVVRVLTWDDPRVHTLDTTSCVIGEELTSPSHQDPSGANGFVFFEKSRYDAEVYDRTTRQGQIFAVNEAGTTWSGGQPLVGPQDPMVVVWYPQNAKGIAWPSKPVEYICRWPDDASKPVDEIIIASELGASMGGTQQVPDLEQVPAPVVYVQNDPNLPGFNPNEEHALIIAGQLYALRDDLGNTASQGITSQPYVLLRAWDDQGTPTPDDDRWRYYVYRVRAEGPGYSFDGYTGQAGRVVKPPAPLSSLSTCVENEASGTPKYVDKNGTVWARSAGSMSAYYYYPLQPDFYYDVNFDGVSDASAGECVPWLSYRQLPTDEPIAVRYTISWPAEVPVLFVGETLLDAKRGLPAIRNQQAVKIAYDELDPTGTDPSIHLATLYEPLSPRTVPLTTFPSGEIETDVKEGVHQFIGSTDKTEKLPFSIKARAYWDPIQRVLGFKGYFDDTGEYIAGDPLLLPNVMTASERDRLKAICKDSGVCREYLDAVDALYDLTRNPNGVDADGDGAVDRAYRVGFEPASGGGAQLATLVGSADKAVSGGTATGTGYLTLVFNDHLAASGPVSMSVLRVDCEDTNANGVGDSVYRGQVQFIPSDNIFDEQFSLRHSADFAGLVDDLEFDWWVSYTTDNAPVPADGSDPASPWVSLARGTAKNEITIGGADLRTLANNDVIVRYGLSPTASGPTAGPAVCPEQQTWSAWAGDPASTTLNRIAKLAEGWPVRVVRGLNPFDSRFSDFHSSAAATYVSMVEQAGRRYEGDIAFNGDPDAVNSIGLIEAYTTVLRRMESISIDGTPPIDHAPTNEKILFMASRIADLYTLLGNEAYADAQDPTIGFTTNDDAYGPLSPAIFAFMNQVPDLLSEELRLLRGRSNDDGGWTAPPVYNRLLWNFTLGQGEVAYQQIYQITDRNGDGFIDETDASIQYPQGHGDAWGHYLTAIKTYYDLLRHPYFSWAPRAEEVNVGGTRVPVDFLDERKFALIAARKAQVGAEVVNLTYRSVYSEEPSPALMGYPDTKTVKVFDSTGQPVDAPRAWGLEDWGRRADQGAYFDWLVANAIVPAEDTVHTGIQKIDRRNVTEIGEITSAHDRIVAQVERAASGINPLGLARGAVPFDIDPSLLDNGDGGGQTHFEQIYSRAIKSLVNAQATFNYANGASQMLRNSQDELEDFRANVEDEERDYKSRLIEIFGTPYSADIGGAEGTYPEGYDGPDLYHYMIVDRSELTGEALPAPTEYKNVIATYSNLADGTFFPPIDDLPSGDPLDAAEGLTKEIAFRVSLRDMAIVKPETWGNSRRTSTGELQTILSEMYRLRAELTDAIDGEYGDLILDIQDQAKLIEERFGLAAETIRLKRKTKETTQSLNAAIGSMFAARTVATNLREGAAETVEAMSDGQPKVVGVSSDPSFGLRAAIRLAGVGIQNGLRAFAAAAEITENSLALAKEDVALANDLEIEIQTQNYELKQALTELNSMIRAESTARTKIYTLKEQFEQLRRDFNTKLAEGNRLLEALVAYRRRTAAKIQEYRYKDMAFRVFRNDALQKYRAQVDAAARYAWLATTAYDYETNLLGTNEASGQAFLTDLVKYRSIGELSILPDGTIRPVPGSNGIAGVLGTLESNFEVLKSQLGFNNPQTESNRFSLRQEYFRIRPESQEKWVEVLQKAYVPDLWQVDVFRRLARPFAPEEEGPQPGLVISFPSTVTSGLNFFGQPLGPDDSSYDPSHFATKIRSVGAWLTNYGSLGLSNTPRIYLIPAGADVLRPPTSGEFTVRLWRVVDQVLPVPFEIGSTDLDDKAWIPGDNTVGNQGDIRHITAFRAYDDTGGFDVSEVATASRLVGRSVWNENWVLIIPGATFLADPEDGIKTFIEGPCIDPGADPKTCERTGVGVTDIKLLFQTYSYAGN